ncbi:SDR family NAD(P)-dependent oxidoreductase [Curtobacterium sp. MCBD17_040]|uniref:SDR family NAD(P)-dependent oxidoreductase n=1 Tax=Curtobacterium sp. MCBD17_040 TaxID=2175674 RepID=UPI000DA984AD|nr:SDR family NAD(P)-dependent oxidoreductase [Curtobacterium sp. MCBD17_040]WIB62271.1 SDR family NAD(P)-dependent oxidoreductase [Curtobacterium sp. MCBD17_040]
MSGDPAVRRTVVVTGASAGLGYFTAEQLAVAGHRVVLACRDRERAARAEQAIRRAAPDASIAQVLVDLADLRSVTEAADAIAGLGPVDTLVNNAGVVGSRRERRTAQGIELQIGTNHLGHFALTAQVLPLLERTAGRVVHVGSISHRWVRLDGRDPFRADPYVNYLQYARSKLAVMLFGFELAQRLADSGSSVRSVVAHPGLALDSLSPSRPGVVPSGPGAPWLRVGGRLVAQGKDAGAVPLVHAAVGDDVRSGAYWGPDGWFQLRGGATVVPAEPHAHDRTAAARLWEASAAVVGREPAVTSV